MGSLYKRGDTWWLKYSRNGKSFRESSGTDKKMVARKILERKEGDIAQGLVPGIQFDKITFDELAEEFLMEYNINARKSLDRAELSIRHLLDGFAGIMITEITMPRIQKYVSDRIKCVCADCRTKFDFVGVLKCPKCGGIKLKKGAANGTINRELSALKRVLGLGARQTPPIRHDHEYIDRLLTEGIESGKATSLDMSALKKKAAALLHKEQG